MLTTSVSPSAEAPSVLSGEAESSYSFPLPSLEQVHHILRELDWGEHYIGIEMNPAAGNRDIYLYSLKEAVQFLRYGTAGMGLSTGAKASICWFDVDSFAAWIRTEVGDAVLADAIVEATQSESAYHGKVQKLGALIDLRYSQLLDMVEAKG